MLFCGRKLVAALVVGAGLAKVRFSLSHTESRSQGCLQETALACRGDAPPVSRADGAVCSRCPAPQVRPGQQQSPYIENLKKAEEAAQLSGVGVWTKVRLVALRCRRRAAGHQPARK